ncbi:major facilitator superfamily domain-containing protein [Xylaria sp. FL1042]|nr:major facilitator superfamily domain-containing protein [Xylaria sp. FL1042]
MESTQVNKASPDDEPSFSEQQAKDASEAPSTDRELTAQGPSESNSPEPVTGAKLVLLLASLTLAAFLIFLDSSIVSTAVPKITDEFNSLKDVGWYGSAYQLGSAVFVPLSGGIYHNFKLKWSFLVFFAIFEVGSAVCGAAPSSAALIIGRVIAGIGASGLNSGAFTILACSVPMEKRPAILGVLFGIAQLGAVLGPLIGGAFTTGYTWRWCFYINLPLGALVAVPLFIMRVPDQVVKKNPISVVRNLHRHLDLFGFALFTPAVVQLLLALQFGGNQFHWSSSQVIGLFVGAGATFIIWTIWDWHKAADALIPFAIIKKPAVFSSGISYAFLVATSFASLFFLPIYFQSVKNASPITAGVYLLATILPQLFAAVLGGKMVTITRYVIPYAIVGGALNAIGTGLFALLQPHTSTGKWVGFSILSGFGRGFALQMPLIATQVSVPPQEVAPATAFIVWCQYIGPTIFLTLYNVVFDAGLRSQLQSRAPNVDAEAVIHAGATGFRKIVSAQDLPKVLVAYSTSLDYTFALGAGAAVVALVAALGMGWKDIQKKETLPPLSQPTDPKHNQDDGVMNKSSADGEALSEKQD